MASQENKPYRHDCFLYSPIKKTNSIPDYITYIPQSSNRRGGFLNGASIGTFVEGRDGQFISKELLATKRMSLGDFLNIIAAVRKTIARDEDERTPTPTAVTGTSRNSTELVKSRIEEFDMDLTDMESIADEMRVKARIYLVVLENQFEDELMELSKEMCDCKCKTM